MLTYEEKSDIAIKNRPRVIVREVYNAQDAQQMYDLIGSDDYDGSCKILQGKEGPVYVFRYYSLKPEDARA